MFLSAIARTGFSDHVPGVVQSMLREFDSSETRVDHQPLRSRPEAPAADRMYKCRMCSLEFSQRGHLKIHRLTHIGEKPYKCTFCPYTAAEKSDLVTHVRTHTGEKPFTCKHCPYKCARKSHLASHMRTHTGEKQHKCPICPYASAWKINMTRHVQLCHNRVVQMQPRDQLGEQKANVQR